MIRLKANSVAFVGLNALRLTSLVVAVLMFTTLIMGLVEDVRAYHDGETMDEAVEDDCAYVPGTWIPMQIWGAFWVELHRMLLIVASIALFLAELSWIKVKKLADLADEWMPCLGHSKGLAALGLVQIVVSSSLLSHYLDVFPLVIGWMLFSIGVIYLTVGILFRNRHLKDVRSLTSDRRQQAMILEGARKRKLVTYEAKKKLGKGSTTISTLFKDFFSRCRNDNKKPSINETFPTLEMPSHRELLQESMRRESHRRLRSSVAIDIDNEHQQRNENGHKSAPDLIKSDDTENIGSQMVSEDGRKQRCSVTSCHSSNFSGSVASSTQVRIGGYSSPGVILAREKAQQRRTAAPKSKASRRGRAKGCTTANGTNYMDDKISAMSTVRAAKRRSAAFVNSARSRLSSSASSDRMRLAKRWTPSSERNIVTDYIEDPHTATPLPPLPAYHPANLFQ